MNFDAVFDSVYLFFRGGVGCTLAVVGVAFLIERGSTRVRRANGALNLASGLAFIFSAIDPVGAVPVDIGNFILAQLMFVIGQAVWEMVVFVFGGQKRRGLGRRMYRVGFVWAQLLWLVPLLDYALGLQPVGSSFENSTAQGPIHLAMGALLYAWTVVALGVSFFQKRWRLTDLPTGSRDARHLLEVAVFIVIVMAVMITSMVLSSEVLYRLSNMAIQGCLVVWFWVLRARPAAIARLRREIHDNRVRQQGLDALEAARIAAGVEAVVGAGGFRAADFRLPVLAAELGVPAYRLSWYFNECLGTSFPVWLNQQRVDWVCRNMAERPDATLTELSTEAGFASKSTFTSQFFRVKGMNPGDYRRRLREG